jgi:hypothetical protein
VLLIPFKAKQLLSHALSELTEEQLSASENLLKEYLFNNIDIESLKNNLDADFSKGGANWNKQRSATFTARIRGITQQVEAIGKKDPEEASQSLADYLIHLFRIKLDIGGQQQLGRFLKMRIENKLDCFSLEKRLDTSKILGGLGLYKNTAEKMVKEVEMIMLLKYSPT